MIWLVWRQHRIQVLVAGIAFSLLTIGLIVLGVTARTRAQRLGLPECLKANLDCTKSLTVLSGQFHSIPPFTGLLLILPVLAGMFIGAPLLSREYEEGTHRFVWTQSISPLRWLSSKIILIFGALALASAALGGMTNWALSPLMSGFGGRFNSTWYDIQGIVPIACMLFALSLGVASGALIRRSIPAMATTLTLYAIARIPVHLIRGHFAKSSLETFNVPLTSLLKDPYRGLAENTKSHVNQNDWIINSAVTGPTGSPLSNGQANLDILQRYCPQLMQAGKINGKVLNSSSCRSSLDGLNLHFQIKLQPVSHFWLIQGVESLLFLSTSALLIYIAIYSVKGR